MNPIKIKKLQSSLLLGRDDYKDVSAILLRLYINRECVNFCKKLTRNLKDLGQIEKILVTLKVLLCEIDRQPDPYEYKLMEPEFIEFFKEIKSEQRTFEPIRWIDAKLEVIRLNLPFSQISQVDVGGPINRERLLTAKEVMQLCQISRSTLDRWIANGLLPTRPNGGRKVYFDRRKVFEWQSQSK